MASQYAAFLASPSTSGLAADATLVYVPTTTELRDATTIIKHFQSQQKQVEKKEEKVLNTIEGSNGLALETETTLLFKTSGGAFLPGIDENLLDERIVTLPMIHIVAFDEAGKIKQMRLYWDQALLLKSVEAIGRSGKNWPIRDSRAQIEAINKSLKAAGQETSADAQPLPLRGPKDAVVEHHRKRSSVSATRDPHASLNLFAPRDPNEDTAARSYKGPTHAPRASAKPASRDLVDIVGEGSPGSKLRSPSPTKGDGVILKAGAGKYHIHNRLFDPDAENERPKSPERKKVFKEKHSHFEFGDGEDDPNHNRPTGKGSVKNQPTWDFNDFSTPPKVEGKSRPDYERQWGAGVQEVDSEPSRVTSAPADRMQDDPPSPVKRPVVHAPRPDAEPHFQLLDEPPVSAEKPKSLQRQKGMGLYQDPLHADERAAVKVCAEDEALEALICEIIYPCMNLS
jgi:hypothetical protein